MLGHARAKFEAGTQQAALGGGDADAELNCNIFHRELSHITQDENFAEQWGNAINFPMDNTGDFGFAEGLFRVQTFVA